MCFCCHWFTAFDDLYLLEFDMHILKPLLIFTALLSGAASVFLFLWWIPVFASLFINWDIANPTDEAISAYKSSNFKMLIYIFREYVAAIAGLLGWIALFALCIHARSDWHSLPKWIPVGCLFGAAAVLIGPYHFSLAIPPIALAMSLLALVKLKTESASVEATQHSGEG
jgi:hypothetical protein